MRRSFISMLLIILFVLMFHHLPQSKAIWSDSWVVVSGDDQWRAVGSGVPIPRIVTQKQQGSPWGILIPGSPAMWMYVDDFNTGPVRLPEKSVLQRFKRNLGSAFPDKNLRAATLRVTADNGYILYVGGKQIAKTYHPLNVYDNKPVYTSDWRRIKTYAVAGALKGGVNEIMIDVADYGGYAGFLMDLFMVFDRKVVIPGGIPVTKSYFSSTSKRKSKKSRR
jgi:hypothetical protein